MFVEGVLWIVRTGSPWRDLPEVFGEWNSVFRRFSRWSQKGVWQRIFEAMSDDPDFEYLIVDSTIVRAHQHASGAKRSYEATDGRTPVGFGVQHPTQETADGDLVRRPAARQG
jgi:transposase